MRLQVVDLCRLGAYQGDHTCNLQFGRPPSGHAKLDDARLDVGGLNHLSRRSKLSAMHLPLAWHCQAGSPLQIWCAQGRPVACTQCRPQLCGLCIRFALMPHPSH